MTRLHTAAASADSPQRALALLASRLPARGEHARLVWAFYDCAHDDAAVHALLRHRFPRAVLAGGTSSAGVMTRDGLLGGAAVGVMVLEDAAGDYGAAAGPLGEDAGDAAEGLLRRALASCGCAGELPELVWIYQPPGCEEAVMAGLRRVVGDRCPILGGTAADGDLSGRRRQLGPEGPLGDGLVVAVLFPSAPVGLAFESGYEPAGPQGVVTEVAPAPGRAAAAGGHELLRIDDRPAAEVYAGWVAAACPGGRLRPGLADSAMYPLGTQVGRVGGVMHYLLAHPEPREGEPGLRTFRRLEAGTRVYLMKGDRQRLVTRAGRVVASARRALPAAQRTAGGLVLYCGGCQLTLGALAADVPAAVAAAFDDAPFLGGFTFGEQGPLLGRNVHGNLMISALVFGDADARPA